MLLNYYTRKTLTAVAATDAALSAFLQCELWRQAFAEADHAANKDGFESIGLLLRGAVACARCACLKQLARPPPKNSQICIS